MDTANTDTSYWKTVIYFPIELLGFFIHQSRGTHPFDRSSHSEQINPGTIDAPEAHRGTSCIALQVVALTKEINRELSLIRMLTPIVDGHTKHVRRRFL